MTLALDLLGGPYDTVFDVGGSIGDFAATAHALWPKADILSFEPIPHEARANEYRAEERWHTVAVAISDEHGYRPFNVCMNQPSASTMQALGSVRRRHFAIEDSFSSIHVPIAPLDFYLEQVRVAGIGALLVKIDVEGHEGKVLAGADRTLEVAQTVIVEVQNDPDIFLGSPSPFAVNEMLRDYGLYFCGLVDAFAAPNGRLLQFDGIWKRSVENE